MKRFIPKKILFSKDDFFVAFGDWRETGNDKRNILGVRWSNFPGGNGREKLWVVLHWDLTIPVLTNLIGLEGTNSEDTMKILNKMCKLKKQQ